MHRYNPYFRLKISLLNLRPCPYKLRVSETTSTGDNLEGEKSIFSESPFRTQHPSPEQQHVDQVSQSVSPFELFKLNKKLRYWVLFAYLLMSKMFKANIVKNNY